tara:strand:+ start:765 stop:1298 length:534 start_codon:yes stop_codon:yes gene_type:complete
MSKIDYVCKECGEKFQGRKRKYCDVRCRNKYEQNLYKTFSKCDVTSDLQDEELGGDWLPGSCNLPTQVLELLETNLDLLLNGSVLFNYQENVRINQILQQLPAPKYEDGSPYVPETSKEYSIHQRALEKLLVGFEWEMRNRNRSASRKKIEELRNGERKKSVVTVEGESTQDTPPKD